MAFRGEQRSITLAQVERGAEVGWFREVARSVFDAFRSRVCGDMKDA